MLIVGFVVIEHLNICMKILIEALLAPFLQNNSKSVIPTIFNSVIQSSTSKMRIAVDSLC